MVERSDQSKPAKTLSELKAQFELLTIGEHKIKLEKDMSIGELDDFYECLICTDIVWDSQSCD